MTDDDDQFIPPLDPLLTSLIEEGWTEEELLAAIESLPEHVVESLHVHIDHQQGTRTATVPDTPIAQALERDPMYRPRDHLRYLSDRLAQAVADVEDGHNRYMTVSMPPRLGKTRLTSIDFPTWLLRKHPDWSIGSISHTDTLAVSWSREVRRSFEENPSWGVTLATDAGAAGLWQTTKRGGMTARSAPGQSIIGMGFKVLIMDDVVRDFASAHSENKRQALWDWWRLNALSRLEPPYLVIALGTRWHEDDLIGRLLSPDHEGDPNEWEQIVFPAIATDDGDVLGRTRGEPLLSPLVDESPTEAVVRWASVRESVGSYAWQSMYQQAPAPAQGAVFNSDWWRYWTTDPSLVDPDADPTDPATRVVLLPPEVLTHARLVDSWDLTFSDSGDWVVGQRWAAFGSLRFLLKQQRGRWTFTEQLERIQDPGWKDPKVHTVMVEKAANGFAVLDTLKDSVAGLKAITPRGGKEVRARAITPEAERGEIILPHPAQFPWVGSELLPELRDFPHAAHDDQVDAFSQAVFNMRTATGGSIQSASQRLTQRGALARLSIAAARIPDRMDAARLAITDGRRASSPSAGRNHG